MKKVPFAYFGTVGDRDMNYYEMRELEEKLEKARAPHRIVYFEGGHEWMSPELAGGARRVDGASGHEVRRAAERPRDDRGAAFGRPQPSGRARGRGEANGGLPWRTPTRPKTSAVSPTSPASRRTSGRPRRSGSSPRSRPALKEARRRDARDEATLRSVNTRLRNALSQPDPPLPALLAADLGIPALRQKAASASSPEERLSAERILANLRAQTGFYLPEDMLARKDTARGRALLLVRAEIDPDNPLVYYNVACFSARSGDAARAIKDLEHAVEKGFTRFELIDTDTDFDPIRQDEAFRKWLAAARPAPPPGS